VEGKEKEKGKETCSSSSLLESVLQVCDGFISHTTGGHGQQSRKQQHHYHRDGHRGAITLVNDDIPSR